ncbi:hypothetical protein JCM19232_5051 [Vibrio ishigakensis]|uniref:beta-lactamase n=1 Tax=Vibrio ishigakensis TaxID=1481914 RepID=A0A0B8PBY3_9VIBR|nr:hypothetical protein JCM19232_5051 [Vibrio ishigakensis]
MNMRGFESYEREIAEGNIAIYLASAKTPDKPILSINAESLFYPASVCKLFYMACFYDKVQRKELIADEEDWRAVKNMVAFSSNDATGYMVNRLCDTSSGANLSEAMLSSWIEKRKHIQRWLEQTHLSIPSEQYALYHSTVDESPYGRDKQAREVLGGNLVSAYACSQMMAKIFDQNCYQAEMREQMKQLLSKHANENRQAADGLDQVNDFICGSLPVGAKCWSKAGWTSSVKHETAFISLDVGDFIISFFSQGEELAQKPQIMPDLTRRALRYLD